MFDAPQLSHPPRRIHSMVPRIRQRWRCTAGRTRRHNVDVCMSQSWGSWQSVLAKEQHYTVLHSSGPFTARFLSDLASDLDVTHFWWRRSWQPSSLLLSPARSEFLACQVLSPFASAAFASSWHLPEHTHAHREQWQRAHQSVARNVPTSAADRSAISRAFITK